MGSEMAGSIQNPGHFVNAVLPHLVLRRFSKIGESGAASEGQPEQMAFKYDEFVAFSMNLIQIRNAGRSLLSAKAAGRFPPSPLAGEGGPANAMTVPLGTPLAEKAGLYLAPTCANISTCSILRGRHVHDDVEPSEFSTLARLIIWPTPRKDCQNVRND